MHFTKTLVSLFAISGLASAQYADEDSGLSRREVTEAVHEEYLAARDEYIEKRELFRRLGGNGICIQKSAGRKQCEKRVNGKSVYCGQCRPTASKGEYCLCNP
ncbi:unnamed protein product [Clonostachys rosea]|uniref:Invertebrate defensins family profile domain-containing protein n=1 Tax=Bionectria ochroleuca TaxID=29856 RepID=A0ABY6U4C6_BIOOC|nr:unnamed protein product [Clonostachys rosea]